ncbi:SDR family oxidoreductase [Hahella aquimaris]|uniref:SDR family oxidoreductase n=1 Tax=Hahella sp. HNIBRBA332 TaxID=3015983 RepID=UPI00273A91B5|nr:SDR family oxidoreductase [Hahella sp. HNIBRBA332]WLQ16294.1 SDR family oxidoreductase [Hahella sp. HNIBRBA332]
MIVITGATGNLGKGVIDNLIKKCGPNHLIASVRDLQKASFYQEKGVSVRKGSFDCIDDLKTAFEGASQVLIVSANTLGEEALRLHRNAIDAAKLAGVNRILYTSHMGARVGSLFAPADQHAGTEAYLAKSGAAYTSLRHGFYAESCLAMIGDGLKRGELRTPEDGPVSWTARSDLAQADAEILIDSENWNGVTLPLTAPQAWTMAEIAEIASDISGRRVRHVVVSDQEWLDAKMAAGMPKIYAELLLGSFQASRRGDFAATHPALENLLGRPARTIREVLTAFLREDPNHQ